MTPTVQGTISFLFSRKLTILVRDNHTPSHPYYCQQTEKGPLRITRQSTRSYINIRLSCFFYLRLFHRRTYYVEKHQYIFFLKTQPVIAPFWLMDTQYTVPIIWDNNSWHLNNFITVSDTVAFTLWVASDYELESRQACASGSCESLSWQHEYGIMFSLQLSRAAEERRGRPGKSGTCHTKSPTLDFQI